jgi:hypothetical protein
LTGISSGDQGAHDPESRWARVSKILKARATEVIGWAVFPLSIRILSRYGIVAWEKILD